MATHTPNFATDSGPACDCGSTLWSYQVATATYYDGDYDNMDKRSDVDARCASCGTRDQFETRSHLETIDAVKWAHGQRMDARKRWELGAA